MENITKDKKIFNDIVAKIEMADMSLTANNFTKNQISDILVLTQRFCKTLLGRINEDYLS